MKESIGSRVGRLIAGSVNAVISAVENAAPEVVMEQALREIDGATDEVRTELGRVIAAKHLANKRLIEESRKHESLAEQIELAVKQGREDLAEAAIARRDRRARSGGRSRSPSVSARGSASPTTAAFSFDSVATRAASAASAATAWATRARSSGASSPST